MSEQLAAELQRHRAIQARDLLATGRGQTAWVFPSAAGTPLHKSTFERRVFHPLLKQAGLRHVRFHLLRHTFASRLLQNRESPVYVKDQLGHHSIQVTVDIYGHLFPGANKAAVDRLDSPSNEEPAATGRNPRATGEDGELGADAVSPRFDWSGREDLNLRPHDPQPRAGDEPALKEFQALTPNSLSLFLGRALSPPTRAHSRDRRGPEISRFRGSFSAK